MARQLPKRWPGDTLGNGDGLHAGADEDPRAWRAARVTDDIDLSSAADGRRAGEAAVRPEHESRTRLGRPRGERRRRRGLSLTWRILFVNVMALAALAGGLLYMDRYRESLIGSELWSLTVQAQSSPDGVQPATTASGTETTGAVVITGVAGTVVVRAMVEEDIAEGSSIGSQAAPLVSSALTPMPATAPRPSPLPTGETPVRSTQMGRASTRSPTVS